MSTDVRRVPAFVLLVIFLIAMSTPLFAYASGMAADMQCIPVKVECACGFFKDSKGNCTVPGNKYLCTCTDNTNGFATVGHCQADQKCHADTGGGKAVDSGLSALGQILGQLLGKLMQPSPPSPSSGSPSSATYGTATCTLTSNTITSDASSTTAMLNWTTTNADTASISPGIGTVSLNGSMQVIVTAPTTYVLTIGGPSVTNRDASGANSGTGSCTTIVIPTIGGLTNPFTGLGSGTCDTLGQLLGTCSDTSASPAASTPDNSNPNANASTIQDSNTPVTQVVKKGATATTSLSEVGAPLLLAPGLTNGALGDIVFSEGGATIFSSSLNLMNNTGVAGFFGSDTVGGGQPEGLATGLCQTRPWATVLFSGALSTSVFDSLCAARGYKVGAPPPVPTPVIPVVQPQQKPPAPKPTAPAASSTPAVKPQAQIWAVPASVPLGTRTSLFWNTQEVTACTETSPDGSFNQSSLSGSASTPPLTGAMTFTISCTDAAGNPVTGYVTVNLSI